MKMGFEWVPYGIYLGFIMGPMSFSDTLYMFPMWVPYTSHVDPRYFPYGFHMNTRCFPDGSHVNLRLIPGFLDVFYWCSVYFCDACLMFWCGYIFSKINSTVSLSRDCASLHKFMSVSLHGIYLRPHFTSFIYGYKLIKGYLFF